MVASTNNLPGMYPNIVKRILMHKSAPKPRSKNTPIGGKMMAKITLQISDQVNAICMQEKIITSARFLFAISESFIKS